MKSRAFTFIKIANKSSSSGGALIVALLAGSVVAGIMLSSSKMSNQLIKNQQRERRKVIANLITRDLTMKLMYGPTSIGQEGLCTANFNGYDISSNTPVISKILGQDSSGVASAANPLYEVDARHLGIKITAMKIVPTTICPTLCDTLTIASLGPAQACDWDCATLRINIKKDSNAVQGKIDIPLKIRITGTVIDECESLANNLFDEVMEATCNDYLTDTIFPLPPAPYTPYTPVYASYNPNTQECDYLRRSVVNSGKKRICDQAAGYTEYPVPTGVDEKCIHLPLVHACPDHSPVPAVGTPYPLFLRGINYNAAGTTILDCDYQ